MPFNAMGKDDVPSEAAFIATKIFFVMIVNLI